MTALATSPPWIDESLGLWPLPTDFDPRAFQLQGVRHALEHRRTVLDIGLGGGKTTISLAVAEAANSMAVLVLCPARVTAVWRDEVDENAARQWVVWDGVVRGARGPLKNPSVARRVEALIEAHQGARRIGRPFMAVVNYEAIDQTRMHQLLLGTEWDLLVCDESHKIAGAGGKRSMKISKVAARVRGRGGRVLLATGTLMPHSALSLYGQFRALDPTVLGSSWTAFKARYAKWRVMREDTRCATCHGPVRVTQPTDDFALCPACGHCKVDKTPIYHLTPRGDRIPDGVLPEREDELMARVAPHIVRVSQAELDAQTGLHEPPPQLRTTRLEADTRKAYDTLEKDLIVRVDQGVITAQNAMINVLRLQQVTSGYGVDADTGAEIQLASPPEKARLLADELADYPVDEPIVVFARFHHDFDQIRIVCEAQGRRYGEISGRSAEGLDGKYMSGDFDVVAVQPQAGGAGINLTRARIGIFYSMDWSLANFDQCKRRILRQGQTRHVTFLVLAVEDTIDISVFYALKRRRDINLAVLERLKTGAPQ